MTNIVQTAGTVAVGSSAVLDHMQWQINWLFVLVIGLALTAALQGILALKCQCDVDAIKSPKKSKL